MMICFVVDGRLGGNFLFHQWHAGFYAILGSVTSQKPIVRACTMGFIKTAIIIKVSLLLVHDCAKHCILPTAL